MAFYVGDRKVSKMYLGDREIKKAYLGDTLVFGTEKNPSRLPEGYTEVEYIHWDGNKTSFELQENIVCNTDKIVFKFFPETYGPSSYAIQSLLDIASSNYAILLRSASANGFQYSLNTATIYYVYAVASSGTLIDADFDFLNNEYTINQTSLSGNKSSLSLGTNYKFIGCRDGTGANIYSPIGNFYQFTHYRNGDMIHDYIPCINPDGIAGLYDLGGNVFIQNTQPYKTGITAGPAV